MPQPNAERHVALDGALNLRDLGGYETDEGRVVRRRCVFRSGELYSLSDRDIEAVAALEIRVVVDLRNEWERGARPNRLPTGVELVERTSPSAVRGLDKTLEEQITLGELPERSDEYLTGVYVDLLTRLAPELRRILELATEAVERPVLFHCAAGKDRTGVAAAVLLGVLGVPNDTILEDYALTTTYYAARRLDEVGGLLEEHGMTADAIRHLVEARTPALEAALVHLHETWDGYDAYATAVLGVDSDLPHQLRSTLTT